MATSLALSALVSVNGQPITLKAGDPTKLAKEFVFTLSDPVAFGSVKDFEKWLNESLGIGISIPETISGLPKRLNDAYGDFIKGQIVLTTLVINVPLSLYKIGISYDLGAAGIPLAGGLAFNGIGVLVTHGVASKLATAVDEKAETLQVTATEGKQFTPADEKKPIKIKIDAEEMLVTKVLGDVLTVTRGTPPAKHPAGALVGLSL